MLRKDKLSIISWCFYDWANSAFAATIMASVLPIYYSTTAANNLPSHKASSYWGYTNTIAMVFISLFSPLLGAMADVSGKRKNYLFRFVLLGILSTGLLFLTRGGDWIIVSILYILGRIGFGGGNVFYDSLLPLIVERKDLDKVSSYGYALGYLGGGLLLLLNLAMILRPHLFGFSSAQVGSRFSFLTVSIWWAVFSIPLFMNVAVPFKNEFSCQYESHYMAGFKKLLQSFYQIKQYKEVWKFLLAYWLYSDGIGTIIIMATIFGTEVGIEQKHLIGAILLVQFLGVPCTLLFAQLAKRFGAKKSILLGLTVYSLISVGGFFLSKPLHFWILAILVALVQGGCQALSRSLYSQIIPPEQSAQFFAFYDISSKFAGIIGPALFGLVGQIFKSSRYGILSLIFFFFLGGFFLHRVHLTSNIS